MLLKLKESPPKESERKAKKNTWICGEALRNFLIFAGFVWKKLANGSQMMWRKQGRQHWRKQEEEKEWTNECYSLSYVPRGDSVDGMI